MAKSGTSRHSKPAGKPVTIDLDPSQVKRVTEPGSAKPATVAKEVPPAEPVGDFTKPRTAAGKEDMAQEKTEKVASPKPAAAAASVKPKPAPDSRAWISHLAAGVAGGAVALGLMSAFMPGGAPTQAQFTETRAAARQAQEQIKSTEAQVVALRDEIAKLANNPAPAQGLEELTSRIAALEGKVNSVEHQATQSASQDSGTITNLQSKLAALETQIADQSGQPALAAAVAATALKSAIDRGGSFVTELDTYRGLAPQSPDLEALGKFAATGVPTLADLNGRFDDVANRIIATERKADPNAGFIDQLVTSAKNLVKARPVGEVSGDSTGAITARIEAALARGDLDRAIAEWETLPDAAKTVSADFATEMKARRDTDALVSQTLANALKAPASPAAAGAAPSAN